MKKLYWRPQRISLRLLSLVALLSIAGLIAVETYSVREKQPFYTEKIKAAQLTRDAFETIKKERIRIGHRIDAESDPALSGIIGELLSPVTTNPGHLPSKQTSANPNFAAVVVHLLKRAGVEPGDKVAIGMSGSFPAINIAVLAAVQVLELKPVTISSAGSSQWGANLPDMMWPDMERVLVEKRVFPSRSVALSRGGIDDRALGLTKDARKMLDGVIERSGLPSLSVKDYADSVEQRMSLYRLHAGQGDYKVYINVGGGTTSVGTKVGKLMFHPGLNRTAPRGASIIDSVMTRFIYEGIPVIHMTKINRLAERYGLPLMPITTPAVGEGKIFFRDVHSPTLTAAILIILLSLLIAFVRLDWGYRIFSSNKREYSSTKPERMV